MRVFLHFILWSLWLILVYLVFAAALVLFFGPKVTEAGEPLETLRYWIIATAFVAATMAIGSYVLRRRLFWKTRRFTIENAKGTCLYALLSFLIPALGSVVLGLLFMPRLSWGEFLMPMLGVICGFASLFIALPVLPPRPVGTRGELAEASKPDDVMT